MTGAELQAIVMGSDPQWESLWRTGPRPGTEREFVSVHTGKRCHAQMSDAVYAWATHYRLSESELVTKLAEAMAEQERAKPGQYGCFRRLGDVLPDLGVKS